MAKVEVPWLLYAALPATALPLIAAVLKRWRLTPPRQWIAWWSAFIAAETVLVTYLGMRSINNHWVNYIGIPVAGAMVLWAFSLWQLLPLARLSIRLAIPLLGVTWILLVLLVESTKTFSLVAEPFAGLLILGVTIYTLIARAFKETGNLLREDWFWVGIGMALYSGITIALPPTSHWLVSRHPDLVLKAYAVKAALEIVSLLLIARGILCPIPATPFGGSSSREPSRSASSSSASLRPW